jgi:hypothetical protein
MKKFISIVSAAAMLSLSSLAGITPVSADPWNRSYQQQGPFGGSFCDRNPGSRQCNNWNNRDSGSNIAAGIIGLAVGAAISGNRGYGTDHVRACQNRYRSYNVRTDTFLGYDGFRHACRL